MIECELFDKIVEQLRSSDAAIRCVELASKLESLGFEVRNGKKSGHMIFVHQGIASFTSGSYTCGHGRNSEIKPIYIKNILKLLKRYKTELIKYLGGENEH
jgi:hypothetical protein